MARALLNVLVPKAAPHLLAAHDIEIRTASPDLTKMVPARRQSVAARLPKAERILVPAARRTLRIANGLAEFVRDHMKDAGPGTLVVENADDADHTDKEFLAVLLRRIDPTLLTLVICAASPGQPLTAALTEHAVREADAVSETGSVSETGDVSETDAVQEVEARPADTHRISSAAPGGAAEPGPEELVERYFSEGFHHAAAELGEHALRAVDPAADADLWWRLVHRTAGALAAISREDEARALFDWARRESVDPKNRATAAYATAMLLVRHHDPARRDLDEALAWINEAVTITSLLPDRRERAFHLSFDLNGKALVEIRRGRPAEALHLVEEAIELAERDLDPGEHPIHRLILRANRARLIATLGDPAGALPDLDAVIAADPGYPDYYIDRGNLLHELGRYDDAVADYETAMRVGPPLPEAYYNRAEIRFATGDHYGALADLDYVLELDPEFADAYANRVGLLVAAGELAKARADVQRGLALDPRNPYLLCGLGQVEAAEGRYAEARSAFDAALREDGTIAAVWAARGAVAFDTGDADRAVADLSRALALGEDAGLLFNRAMALRALGRGAEARADLERAADLDPGDGDIRQALEEP